MAYRIAYQSQKKHDKKRNSLKLPAWIICFFLIFLAIVETTWQEGALWLNNQLFSSGRAVAVSALNGLAEELKLGNDLLSTFSDFFCNLIP